MKKVIKLLSTCLIAIFIMTIVGCSNNKVNTQDEVKNNLEENKKKTMIKGELAKADLEYLRKKINSVHPGTIAPYGKPKDELIDEVKKKIGDEISNEDFYFIVQEVLASLNDGHSSINIYTTLKDEKTTRVKYLWLNDGLYIGEDLKNLKKGDKVLNIGTKSVDEILESLCKVISHENLNWVRACSEGLLNREYYINYLGLKDKNNRLNFKILRNGQEQTESIAFKELIGANPFPMMEICSDCDYKILDEEKLGVFELNKCYYTDEYKKKVSDFFSSISKQNIKNIVVDLRKNTGGTSQVIEEFLRYLPNDKYKFFVGDVRICDEARERGCELQGNYIYDGGKEAEITIEDAVNKEMRFNGNIYVLTSKYTFSSANWFAAVFQDNKLGKIVGEPTGNAATGYGDTFKFTFENSGMEFRISNKKFTRPNSKAEKDIVQPDMVVETNISDVLQGIDTHMEAVKKIIKSNKN